MLKELVVHPPTPDTDHIEGTGCLFEESHQPALREVLAATDSLLVGAHDVVRDRALFQHVRRYVLQVGKYTCFEQPPVFQSQICNSL